jgi:beta-glucosidase
MVVSNASTHPDNLEQALIDAKITRAQLQRNAMNVCRYIMATPAFERFTQSGGKIESADDCDLTQLPLVAAFDNIGSLCEMPVFCHEGGKHVLAITLKCDASEYAQTSISVITDGCGGATATTGGTGGEKAVHKRILLLEKGRHSITFEYDENMLEVTHAELRKMD